MERYKNFVKLEQIRELVRHGQNDEAMAIADTIDFRRLKNATDVSMISELYMDQGMLERAKECLLELHSSFRTRSVLMQLIDLSIRLEEAAEAELYLKEFEALSPHDFYNCIFRYKIDLIEDKPYPELIESLEELKREEYIEEWAYELAKLYHKVGDAQKCIAECNDMIIWFGSGEYVERARALRAYYRGELDISALLAEQDRITEQEHLENEKRLAEEFRQAEAAKLDEEQRLAEELKLAERVTADTEAKRAAEAEAKRQAEEEAQRAEEAKTTYERSVDPSVKIARSDAVLSLIEEQTATQKEELPVVEPQEEELPVLEPQEDKTEDTDDIFDDEEIDHALLDSFMEKAAQALAEEVSSELAEEENEHDDHIPFSEKKDEDSDIVADDTMATAPETEEYIEERYTVEQPVAEPEAEEPEPVRDRPTASELFKRWNREQEGVSEDASESAVTDTGRYGNSSREKQKAGEIAREFTRLVAAAQEKAKSDKEEKQTRGFRSIEQTAAAEQASSADAQDALPPGLRRDTSGFSAFRRRTELLSSDEEDRTVEPQSETPISRPEPIKERNISDFDAKKTSKTDEINISKHDIDDNKSTSSFDTAVPGLSNEPAPGIVIPKAFVKKAKPERPEDRSGKVEYTYHGVKEHPIPAGSRLEELLSSKGDTLGDYFGFFAYQSEMRAQIIKTMELLLNPQVRNICVAVTGGRQSGVSGLVKGIARMLYQSGVLNERTCAVTDAAKLNRMSLNDKVDKLIGRCLVIERAGDISQESAESLYRINEQYAGKLAVIICDSKSAVMNLFRTYRDLNSMFPIRIHIPELGAGDLLELVHSILQENEYAITNDADTYLASKLADMCRDGKDARAQRANDLAHAIMDKIEVRGARDFIAETLAGHVPQRENMITVDDVRSVFDDRA